MNAYREVVLPLERQLHEAAGKEGEATYDPRFRLFESYCDRLEEWQRVHGFDEEGWGWVARLGPGIWFRESEMEWDPLLRNLLILPIKGWSPTSTRESRAGARERMVRQLTQCVDEYLHQVDQLATRKGFEPVTAKRERDGERWEVFDWLIDRRCHGKSWREIVKYHGAKDSTIRSAVARMEGRLTARSR